MQLNRLPEGGRIDRSKPLTFQFNGRRYQGYSGDTLAAALLANGVSVVGRSVKYHRPRGIVGSGMEEPNAIFQIGTGASTLPNMRATEVELYDGLVASSMRGWPSLNVDLLSINDRFSRLLAAGFYYKTFMWPRCLWHWYEDALRQASGLGASPQSPDPDHYAHRNAHCDVLVVGAGPAGLMAALAAAKSGARVILADEQSECGGSLLHSTARLNGNPASDWLHKISTELSHYPELTLLSRSTVFGYYDYNFLTILQRCDNQAGQTRQDLWRVRAKRVVLAPGAFERPLVFPNNDRPGVMQAAAVSHYIQRYAVCPGQNAIIFTNNDSAYQTALDMLSAGAAVTAIIDSRCAGAATLADKAAQAGIDILKGHVVTHVYGKKKIRAVQVTPLSKDGKSLHGVPKNIACDLLAMSGGWSPAVHLHSQAGGKNVWHDERHCFIPAESRQNNIVAGAGNGCFELGACLEQGKQAGLSAAEDCGFTPVMFPTAETEQPDTHATQALWRVPSHKEAEHCPKQFVDYQNDTTVADIRLAVREGFQNVEHVKRYTALGFGTDQGKLGNINGMAILAECLNEAIANVGTTTFRPAYTPVTFGAIAGPHVGDLYEPVRKTALHSLHEAADAEFEVVGQWLRPGYFPQADEDIHTAVARECLAARNSLAIMDASTLGKIDVQGPDAVAFLERIYTHHIDKIKIGRCAYAIMLGEDGMVMDDGIMARLGEQHFYLTTTTGGAANVLNWLEQWLQTEWPELKVYLTSVTDRWSTIALVGPNSRKLLDAFSSDMDFSKKHFPFMSVQSGLLAGFDVQVFRVSFSGELAFEINVQSDYAIALWEALMAAGQQFSITPYGTESMHVLRAEKGFAIVGQDTDGSVSPVDMGMSWLLSKDKEYIGKRSLQRADCLRDDRKQLIGLLSADGKTMLTEGTALVEKPGARQATPILGHVTSSYQSACLGHPIAMALVIAGRARQGEHIYAALRNGRFIRVKIVSPLFYDPKGERQGV